MKFRQRILALMTALSLSAGILTGCSSQISAPFTGSVMTSVHSQAASDAPAEMTAASETAASSAATDTELTAESVTESTSAPQSSAAAVTTGSTAATSGQISAAEIRTTGAQTKSTTAGTKAKTDTQTSSLQTVKTETEPQTPKTPEQILAGMTLHQKVAQMMFVGVTDETVANAAAKAGVGGLCLFALPFKGKTKTQVQAMTAKMQRSASIPLILAADEEGGPINRVSKYTALRSEPFPSGKDLYAEGGWEAVIRDTREKATLLKSLGLNANLAPVADVPLSESNYIADRCFSLNANETAAYIRTVVTEMEANGFGSTLKHFPGYGGSVDTHKNMGYDNRDYSAFTEGDFLPFIAGIEAGADAVMVSHNIVKCMDSQYPASLSPAVHKILREDLHFTGVVISDDLGMNAIIQFTGGKNPAVAAVLAGNDLVAYSDYKTSISAVESAVQAGTISESQIDASVLRILRWKQSLGLLG